MTARRLAVWIVSLSLLTSMLALAAPTVSLGSDGPTAVAEARTFGGTPLEDVRYWADQHKRCGLSRDQLAAMMISVTYPETGAPSNQAPSPMTLGRWDNQSGLYAFGDSNTPYRNAFWHAGLGMFAFDSAGGWGMTASERIDTWTSSARAAETMAGRWCANPSLDYVWAPWFGCSQNRCRNIYNEIYQNGQLTNLTGDLNVGRMGGMEYRVCRLGDGTTVNCWFVNPQAAQGYRGFLSPAFGPSPVSAPFYVYARNGREYRHWLAADSGYSVDVSASRPLGRNARSNLSWSTTTPLCDETAQKGTCLPGQPTYHDPFGAVDIVSGGDGSVRVAGWAIDPDTVDAVELHVYIAGSGTPGIMADQPRPDVGAAYPQYGDDHGFDTLLPATPGAPEVCVFAINQQAGHHTLLRCETVFVGGPPFGSLDVVEGTAGSSVRVAGWAIDPDTVDAVELHAYVDGSGTPGIMTDVARPDVAAAHPAYGELRGFDRNIATATGEHEVCVFAINQGFGNHSLLACRAVLVASGSPFGWADVIQGKPGGVHVLGWAIDPDTPDPVEMHVYVDGHGVPGIMADQPRPDVGAAFPGYGDDHGFDVTVPMDPGWHWVCVFAINEGFGNNTLVRCEMAWAPFGDPIGSVDVLQAVPGGVRVAGWALDPDTIDPVEMHVYVDGSGTPGIIADLPRPDVAVAHPDYGVSRGFDVVLPASAGPHDVCVFAINQGVGSHRLLRCARVG